MTAWLLAAALLATPTQTQQAQRHHGSKMRGNTSARGITGESANEGEPAGKSGRSGPQSPGFELGPADGMAGGRTDRGPKGAVGWPDDHSTVARSNRMANAANNRPEGTAPQRADVEGGGDPHHEINYAEPLKEDGPRIPAHPTHGHAQGTIAQPAGAAPEGSAGHSGTSSGGAQGPAPAPQPRSK